MTAVTDGICRVRLVKYYSISLIWFNVFAGFCVIRLLELNKTLAFHLGRGN